MENSALDTVIEMPMAMTEQVVIEQCCKGIIHKQCMPQFEVGKTRFRNIADCATVANVLLQAGYYDLVRTIQLNLQASCRP